MGKEKIGEFTCYRKANGEIEMKYKSVPGTPELTKEQEETNKLICDGFALLANNYDGNLDKAMEDIIVQLEAEKEELQKQIEVLNAELPKQEEVLNEEVSEDE